MSNPLHQNGHRPPSGGARPIGHVARSADLRRPIPGRSAIAVAILLLVVGGTGRPARAQFFDPTGGMGASPNIEGFTVSGKGYVSAKPNYAEIDMDVSASSELTADAIVKYRDAKKRIHDAFAALKLKSIAVEERGLLVDQKGQMQSPYYFDYSPNPRNKTEVQLSRKLVVKASDIRKMDEESVLQLVGRLLDVAQDAGAHVGPQNNMNYYYYYRWGMEPPNGLVRFILEDFDKLQEEAYEKAIADARARAERLARLSRVELGPIVAIREVFVPGERANNNANEEMPRKRLEMSRFQEIPVRVELMVRFEVHHPKAERKGQAGQP
ncbi:MAG: SIMPL domain-containing protein [Isosphaeraceae bacterium]